MKRNSLNNDISRILDPSYSPAASKQPLSVYVDTHGYLHDPDYRHFPTITPSPNPNTSHPDTDDEETTPVDSDFYSHLTNAYNRAGNAHSRSKRSNQYPQYSQYSHIYASYRSPYHYFSTPAPTTSSYSPPTSYDSDNTVFDDAVADDSTSLAPAEDSHTHCHVLKKKLGMRRGSGSSNGTTANHNNSSCSPTTSRRRRSAEERRSSLSTGGDSPRCSVDDNAFHHPHRHLSPHNELDEQQFLFSHPSLLANEKQQQQQQSQSQIDNEKQDSSAAAQHEQSQNEWTPTCTQNLRRQWQALSLRFRFSMFRAQRRIKRRVQDLI